MTAFPQTVDTTPVFFARVAYNNVIPKDLYGVAGRVSVYAPISLRTADLKITAEQISYTNGRRIVDIYISAISAARPFTPDASKSGQYRIIYGLDKEGTEDEDYLVSNLFRIIGAEGGETDDPWEDGGVAWDCDITNYTN